MTANVVLTPFMSADTRVLFDIRNHPSVRAFMADSSPLEWAAHRGWTQSNLVDGTDIRLFMVRVGGAVRGFSVLKALAPAAAEIGVMLREPERHPVIASMATAATLQEAFERMGCESLVSWVVPGHDRALAINRAFGAREVPSAKPGMLQFQLTRSECLGNELYRRLAARIAARSGRVLR